MNLRPYVFWNEDVEARGCEREARPTLGRKSAVERDRVLVAVDALERDVKRADDRRAANMLNNRKLGAVASASVGIYLVKLTR